MARHLSFGHRADIVTRRWQAGLVLKPEGYVMHMRCSDIGEAILGVRAALGYHTETAHRDKAKGSTLGQL